MSFSILNFDNSQIYIIFEVAKDPLEIDINSPINQTNNLDLIKNIQLNLDVFDHFRLSRIWVIA